VKFIDGRPFKSGYRRFRIKTVKGIDDYAMIAEVVRRRYKYALRGEELWPDLLLIDGGLGHLKAAKAALCDTVARNLAESVQDADTRTGKRENAAADTENALLRVRIASIAKKEEDIFLEGSKKPLRLPANSPARKLLQYVRDEAHRFAQHYHHILRGKKMLNEKT
jgi:excinuclease ABC subunit C